MATGSEIKPVHCGCGGEAFTHILGNEIAKGYYIACDECGTKTKVFGYEAEAITAWNRAMSAERIIAYDPKAKIYYTEGYVSEKLGSKNHE